MHGAGWRQRWNPPKLPLGRSDLTSTHYLDLRGRTRGRRFRAPAGRLAGDKRAEADSGLVVFFSGVHLFAFDLGGRALTSQEAGLGLTLPHLVLTLGVDVHFAHPALQALAGVSPQDLLADVAGGDFLIGVFLQDVSTFKHDSCSILVPPVLFPTSGL